jgi:hypothetical protein
MVLRTNTEPWGELGQHLFDKLISPQTTSLAAVSGYVGKETVDRLIQLVSKRPELSIKLVVGMAAKEGLSERSYESLGKLHQLLSENSATNKDKDSGVYWYFSGQNGERSRGLHAKAYRITGDQVDDLFIGSSNFSFSGLSHAGNVELNVLDTSSHAKREFDDFFARNLGSGFNFVPYDKVEDFPIRGKTKQQSRKKTGLQKVAKPSNFKNYPFVDIDLALNIEEKTRSSLNVCFGRGRWSRTTGKVKPREWYEVEVICPKIVTQDPAYPKGDFQVVTSDGYSFLARTQGDYSKNLRSKDSLLTLGLWIKSCLEEAGALTNSPQELVTLDTFENYGNSILRLYRKDKSEAIFHFPQDPTDL